MDNTLPPPKIWQIFNLPPPIKGGDVERVKTYPIRLVDNESVF